jgi:transcription antitermination protein NusB
LALPSGLSSEPVPIFNGRIEWGYAGNSVAAMPQDERSKARILALQALCLFDALGDRFSSELDKFLGDPLTYTDLGWKRRPRPELISLARSLAAGAWRHRMRCDELLAENVLGWSVGRMQPVDRSILRLGLYELLEAPETPAAVVINEAIELARTFGGADSPAFVNGVLDGVRRRVAGENEEPGVAEDQS